MNNAAFGNVFAGLLKLFLLYFYGSTCILSNLLSSFNGRMSKCKEYAVVSKTQDKIDEEFFVKL